MNDKVKGIITGAVSAALIIAVPVLAKEQKETITAVYNNIKLMVDGNGYSPKDADGATVEPFIYNGTTYLPVRAVANAFNKPVDWDQENAIIYLGTKTLKPAKQLSLWNRSYIECTDTSAISSKEEKGQGYIKCRLSVRDEKEVLPDRFYKEESVTYPLNALAKTVSGKFYIRNDRESEGVLEICNSNGKTLYKSPIMRTSTAPVEFNVNVENEIALMFKFECTSDSWSSADLYVADPIIVSADY